MKSDKLKIVKRILIIVILLISVIFLLFNEHGIIKYLRLSAEVDALNEEISDINSRIDSLEAEIKLYKYDLGKIEKAAREKYRMKSENEEALIIDEK